MRPLASLAMLLALSGTALAAGLFDGSQPARLVRLPDGRRINLRCAGPNRAPTIIFESGYAATSTEWFKVLPEVARQHYACAYDRPGYGWSDPGPMPRDGEAIARDLDATLRAAGIAGPFVLVGHSAGGLYARLFAKLRRWDVVGMVLVDPMVEHQDRRYAAVFGRGVGSLSPVIERDKHCAAAAARHALDPQLIRCGPSSPASWRTLESEAATLMGATSDEIDSDGPSLGDMPLVVLTAQIDSNAVDRYGVLWATLHSEVAAHSTRGSAQLVARSSHAVMIDRPDAIIAAVDEVIAAASRRPKP